MVLAVTLPLVVLGAGLVVWAAEGRRDAALEAIGATAHALQTAVDRELDLTVAALEALSTSPSLDESLASGPGSPGAVAFRDQALSLVARRAASLSMIWLIPAPAGDGVRETLVPVPVVNTLVQAGQAPPALGQARYPPRPVGAVPTPGAAFRAAIETGRVHVGDLVQGSVAGWTIAVTLPVWRGDRIVGVLGAGIRPAHLGAVMRAELAAGAGVAALVDRGGVIVARTVPEQADTGRPAATGAIAFQRNPSVLEAREAVSLLEGTPVYAHFRRLDLAPFALAYGAPRALVDGPLNSALLAAIGGGLAALGLAAAAAWWFGRRLGAEVAALGADALRLAKGRPLPDRPASQVREVEAARGALLGSTAALAASEARFNRAVAAARMGTWEWDAIANRLTGSPGREALYGRAPGSLPTREALLEAVHPEDQGAVAAAGRRATDPSGDGDYVAEFRTVWPDGTIRWLRTKGRAEFAPDGTPVRMSGAVVDVTERRLAEAALRDSERRLRLAQEAAGIGVWERDLVTGEAIWSVQEYRLHGLDPARPPPSLAELRAMILAPDQPIGLLSDRLREAAADSALDAEAAAQASEYRIRRPDTGAIRWLQVFGRVLPGPDGRPARVIGVSLDVTERREAEERQTLLAREVDHRAKNALAVALSVVQLAPRDAPPGEFAAAVTERIAAMARAHSLLAESGWSGADFGTLAEGELAAHAGHVTLAGPPVRLAAAAAQPVAMLLHELAANAARHGALSQPGGSVALTWEVTGCDTLRLVWREAGGPEITGPPSRSGFGSRLIASLTRRQLGGSASFDWSDPAGLVGTVQVPAAQLVGVPPAGGQESLCA
ncbi:PAS domain-containing protein [Falsiroseomonas sp. E2-1-a20]|uniref:PAS domain-containing protein n=1 Tax=Falsiroseomonas sp. E2-1-a20 TaxID=3239300 RepID=UPI003F2CAA8A